MFVEVMILLRLRIYFYFVRILLHLKPFHLIPLELEEERDASWSALPTGDIASLQIAWVHSFCNYNVHSSIHSLIQCIKLKSSELYLLWSGHYSEGS